MPQLGEILDALGEMYPWELAGPADGSGLLVGTPASEVSGVLCAVDPVGAAVQRALDSGCELLAVHHPHLLKGCRAADAGTLGGELVRTSVLEGLSIVACHHNADHASGGLADLYAARLGMEVEGPLVPSERAYLVKVVVFVPPEAVDDVSGAMASAGAGEIGDYSHCGFRSPGTGTFIPGRGAKPYSGTVGELNREAEVRLEMIAPSYRLSRVLASVEAAHPYEEAVCDVYRLDNDVPWGLGRFGILPGPRSPLEIMKDLQSWCGSATGLLEGEEDAEVVRVAVAPGLGDEAVGPAVMRGARLLVTGELSWHRQLEAMEAGVSIIMLGHAESEAPFVDATIEGLAGVSAWKGWDLDIIGFDYAEWKGA